MLQEVDYGKRDDSELGFQWAPTLGGECYSSCGRNVNIEKLTSFNGHPPLGVNATSYFALWFGLYCFQFQWAPTLGGECYSNL